MAKLNEKALLVQLSISQWAGRKYDKKATKQVSDTNGTSMDAGRYNKALLPMNDELKMVQSKANLIRQSYYTNTLPWGIEGTQMLPTANYMTFMADMRSQKAEWQGLVDTFLRNYDYMKARAQQALGALYNEADYPTAGELAGKFRMDIAVFPVPGDDFRVEQLDAGELQAIQQDVERRVQGAQKEALQEIWRRLYARVEHMADKLSDPSSIFRDSMVESTRELCALLPRLNFSDDPDLEAMRQDVMTKLAGNHPDALRNDPDLRRDKAAEAKAIMAKMSIFMGNTQ